MMTLYHKQVHNTENFNKIRVTDFTMKKEQIIKILVKKNEGKMI